MTTGNLTRDAARQSVSHSPDLSSPPPLSGSSPVRPTMPAENGEASMSTAQSVPRYPVSDGKQSILAGHHSDVAYAIRENGQSNHAQNGMSHVKEDPDRQLVHESYHTSFHLNPSRDSSDQQSRDSRSHDRDSETSARPSRRSVVTAKDAPAMQKRARPRKHTPDASGNSSASSAVAATDGSAPTGKKPRVLRGTGPQALKKKAEREAKLAQEAAAAAAAAAQAESQTAPSTLQQIQLNPNQSSKGTSTPPIQHSTSLTPSHTPSREAPITTQPSLHLEAHAPPTPSHQLFPPHRPLTPQARSSSGQNYDPIRSATVTPRATSPILYPRLSPLPTAGTSSMQLNAPATTLTPPNKPGMPATSANRSPSIAQLIDPPDTERTTVYAYTPKRARLTPPPSLAPPANQTIPAPQSEAQLSTQVHSPSPAPVLSVAPSAPTAVAQDGVTAVPKAQKDSTEAMDIDVKVSTIQSTTANNGHLKKQTPNATSASSPTSHSPKPTRAPAKEAPTVPIGSGSGLLSGALFGAAVGVSDASAAGSNAPTVELHIPLTGDNQYINFTRLAEEKYGFAALHPRLAAQRERLARVAAAGAALEHAQKAAAAAGSGLPMDDMSVDLSNDEADENSNAEMGGMDDKSGNGGDAAAPPKRRKRVMKEDMYDKDDDFVDDTELAWEEQAAVSKDGFFVYSGPLVPEGEEAKVERAVEAPKRGRASGRGSRGGGRGNRAGAGTTRGDSTATSAAATSTSATNTNPTLAPAASTTNTGSSTNGGTTTSSKEKSATQRRPRRTKEEIERAAREKAAQKEGLAVLAIKPAPALAMALPANTEAVSTGPDSTDNMDTSTSTTTPGMSNGHYQNIQPMMATTAT